MEERDTTSANQAQAGHVDGEKQRARTEDAAREEWKQRIRWDELDWSTNGWY